MKVYQTIQNLYPQKTDRLQQADFFWILNPTLSQFKKSVAMRVFLSLLTFNVNEKFTENDFKNNLHNYIEEFTIG
jgi:hypothetical protein